jgi:hypothetical protein
MFTHAKAALIVVGLLLCTLALMGARSNVPAGSGPVPTENPAVADESRPVLVEAFVVEVGLPALAKLGVSPIGQEPHAVSVADILKCLDNNQARVIAGAKAAAAIDGGTEVRAAATTYIRRETGGPQQQVNYQSRETGEQFSVSLKPAPLGVSVVAVQFSFSHSLFREKEKPADAPEGTATWQWSGSAVLTPGAPKIVAATQDTDVAVFLLLTAHVAPE